MICSKPELPYVLHNQRLLARFLAGSRPVANSLSWRAKSGVFDRPRSHISSDGIKMEARIEVVGIAGSET